QVGTPLIPFGQPLEVRRSLVSGGFSGGDNLDIDPLFVDPSGATGNYRLRSNSPAIDAGNNALITPIVGGGPELDLDRTDRRFDAPAANTGFGTGPLVDIGAFEFRPVTTTCAADFNNSGTRDVADIFAFLSAWFANAPGSDFNASGTRDVADIFAFLSAWFAGC
ncbi:MAG: hypothetical protein K2Q20_01145, partial [Phycisphaerales bacterium]|nr:hypothetical protein [Phycisphaerales bacterium]